MTRERDRERAIHEARTVAELNPGVLIQGRGVQWRAPLPCLECGIPDCTSGHRHDTATDDWPPVEDVAP